MGGPDTSLEERGAALPSLLVPLRRWLRRSTPTGLHALKTSLAAGASWLVANNLLGNHDPIFAPLAALLTVQVTVWDSVSRGLQRVGGVVVGVVVAYSFARLAGVSAWSLTLVILVAFLLGRALRLGSQGSIQVPVSALLVLVLGATDRGYAVDRVVDTAIGAGLGIAVNLIAFPAVRVDEAEAAVAEVAEALAVVLDRLADLTDVGRVATTLAPWDPTGLLRDARALAGRLDRADRAVAEVRERARWNPSGHRARTALDRLQSELAVLPLVERQVRGMARTLAEIWPAWPPPDPAASCLRDQLAMAALCLRDRQEARLADPDAAFSRLLEALEHSREHGIDPLVAAAVTSVGIDARRVAEELSL
jgi:uncharacterized membrane protein YccC